MPSGNNTSLTVIFHCLNDLENHFPKKLLVPKIKKTDIGVDIIYKIDFNQTFGGLFQLLFSSIEIDEKHSKKYDGLKSLLYILNSKEIGSSLDGIKLDEKIKHYCEENCDCIDIYTSIGLLDGKSFGRHWLDEGKII